ncbi:MAG: universal stress protein [Nitrosopumilaceae archaeon]|nr:universal stress protein [Nitrosopumilaceae archaeon]NIU02363.1 universal stress protein [Nitrosopumilaceae archaeon]NIU88820.1 universal stress protein [Nitrosopumilaceae archaeon]NIV66945.1 universal stress protein [Nitrosopumilaceae archaeon]NIX62964.1 universal stress protein [Nitrosopumilaceae archaeon]
MAKKLKKILVPLDGSKNSLRGLNHAIDLAKSSNSSIVGLYVLKIPPVHAISSKHFLDSKLKGVAKKILKEAETKCSKNKIPFKGKVVHGSDPGYDIVKFNKKEKTDMVVIGARGVSRIKEIFLGSVSNYVLHKSKVPVLVVK